MVSHLCQSVPGRGSFSLHRWKVKADICAQVCYSPHTLLQILTPLCDEDWQHHESWQEDVPATYCTWISLKGLCVKILVVRLMLLGHGEIFMRWCLMEDLRSSEHYPARTWWHPSPLSLLHSVHEWVHSVYVNGFPFYKLPPWRPRSNRAGIYTKVSKIKLTSFWVDFPKCFLTLIESWSI